MSTSTLTWQWPWAALAGLLAIAAIVLSIVVLSSRRNTHASGETHATEAPIFSLTDDLATEEAAQQLKSWRRLNRLALALLIAAALIALTLLARPSTVDIGEERASRRDIVLCLDVSGSTLPYDREVIETYLNLVSHFQGERIGLSIFNSTSRTVFPLTDDYDLVTDQLTQAATILKGVETQDDIDKMSDEQYQRIANWLEGTQNRANATSLIGDGVVSCAAMLPGFAYGSTTTGTSNDSSDNSADRHNATRQRAASIVLATDNVVSGEPTYTLSAALDLVSSAGITVDGLFSGPKSSESEATTTDMRNLIESHGGFFLTQSNGADISQLVREIDRRREAVSQRDTKAAISDAPGWLTLALAICMAGWMITAWRLRR